MTVPLIQTPRLTLVPATAALVAQEIAGPEALGEALGAIIPADWPPELLRGALHWFLQRLQAEPEAAGWLTWYGLVRDDAGGRPLLAASAGFLGPPQEGSVEVGYSVLPAFQGQGYATEMAGALVQWALSQPAVRRVAVEVAVANLPSRRVIEKLGFAPVGGGREAGYLRLERTAGPR